MVFTEDLPHFYRTDLAAVLHFSKEKKSVQLNTKFSVLPNNYYECKKRIIRRADQSTPEKIHPF